MKYESTILKRLIDTYGVVGNPRYISEIIKEFIVRGKERFPELFTYQADWLAHIDEFGLNPTYTVSYTGQSIYAPNTLERPVKSAILTGQTLVNLLTYFMPNVDYMDGQYRIRFSNVDNFDKITIVNKNSKTIKFSYFSNGWQEYEIPAFNNVLVEIPKETNEYNIFALDTFGWDSTNYREAIDNIVLLHGDYVNVDIPYFEGMQSVKMPVLTTTGKNLFPTSTTLTIDRELGNNGEIINGGGLVTKEYIPLTFFDQCVFSSKASWLRIAFYDIDKKFISLNFEGNVKKLIFTPPSGAKFFRVSSGSGGDARTPNELQYQIEKGTIPTTYEPFKSNILTVNEDVTLRSNGGVCDELNLLTGQLTQRIGEDGVVLSQEVIKTVDLTTLDQNGQNVKQLMSFKGGTHFNTRSSEGTPLPLVSVSVETDLEEVLMMCSLEGNTI